MGSRALAVLTRSDETTSRVHPNAGETTRPAASTAPLPTRAARYLSRRPFDRSLAVVVALTAFGAQWFRFATFRSAVYDLAVFEHVVWKMANGRGATTSLTAWNTFGDHVSPVLLAFVPLYRLAASPLWFFAAQAIAFGLAILSVRALTDTLGLRDRPDATNARHPAVFSKRPAVFAAVQLNRMG